MLIATFSGVRMIHNQDYTKRVRQYVSAFARNLPAILEQVGKKKDGLIIVGRDGRSVGEQYEPIVIKCLVDNGYHVMNIGVVPTPTVQQMVQLHRADGGVIITASHNGPEWCGLKFVGPTSIFLTPAECELVYGDLRQEEAYQDLSWDASRVALNKNACKEHIEHVLKSDLIPVDKIRERKYCVAFNGMNASGNAYIEELAHQLNLRLVRFNEKVGPLPAHPEPTPANLEDFKTFLKESQQKIDVGFAVDPDADRCVVINRAGVPIVEEMTLALCCSYVLGKAPQKYFVKNCSTSLSNDCICEAHGTQVVETAVGEVNVCLKMRELGARLGGEGNGGVILADAHLGRDSIVAICLVLSLMASTGKTIETLVAAIKSFSVMKEKYQYEKEKESELRMNIERLSSMAQNNPEKYKLITVDGVKLLYEEKKKWVHVRFSNTEPIVRIIAEASTERECKDLIDRVEAQVFGAINSVEK